MTNNIQTYGFNNNTLVTGRPLEIGDVVIDNSMKEVHVIHVPNRREPRLISIAGKVKIWLDMNRGTFITLDSLGQIKCKIYTNWVESLRAERPELSLIEYKTYQVESDINDADYLKSEV